MTSSDVACSVAWDAGDLPAWGSAAVARFWVALEQPGPWGRDAFTGSRLDPAVGAALASRSAGAGGRALLIRAPGRSPAPRGPGADEAPRRVFVALGMPQGKPVLLTGHVRHPEAVLDLPWAALAAGDAEEVRRVTAGLGLRRATDSVLLICTNAKRDVCCATRGLPLAAALGATHPGRVYECSHTGGHRFAPTGVLLPTGATLGRLTVELGRAALSSPGTTLDARLRDRRRLRGLAHLPPALQAADAFARADGLGDLAVSTEPEVVPDHATGDPGRVVVSVRVPPKPVPPGPVPPEPVPAEPAAPAGSTSGSDPAPQRRLLAVITRDDGVLRPVSCGRAPEPGTTYEVEPLG